MFIRTKEIHTWTRLVGPAISHCHLWKMRRRYMFNTTNETWDGGGGVDDEWDDSDDRQLNKYIRGNKTEWPKCAKCN